MFQTGLTKLCISEKYKKPVDIYMLLEVVKYVTIEYIFIFYL